MIGRTISHYTILEKLGEGGMGVVYKARDLDLDRCVAIKVLPPHFSTDEDAVKRFVHEAKAASSLNHSNIGVIHEIGRIGDGETFIVMACYDGETLRNRIDRGGMTIEESLDIASQIAAGLAKAHEMEIVHRDIKPSNILVTNDGEVKIIDFGLAKLAGKTRLTREDSTVGTAAYMSPEQARGEDVDHRSDIFSLGTILYEMLVGETPFKGKHEAALLYEVVHEDPGPFPAHLEKLTEAIKSIVDKALRKNPADRYQHSADMKNDLDEFRKETLSGEGRRSRRVLSSGNARKSIGFWALTTAIVAIIAIVIFIIKPLIMGDEAVSEEPTLAIIDFRDLASPDDPSFAVGLTSFLHIGLDESGPIRVISSDLIYDIRRRLFGSGRGVIEPDQILEVARESDCTLFLAGQIIGSSDERYVTWRLVETVRGRNLAARRTEGGTLADLADGIITETLPFLDKESNAEVASAPTPVASISTDSPQAYRYYIAGVLAFGQRRGDDAIQEFERAIKCDSMFAMAYAELSLTHYSALAVAQDKDLAIVYAERAWNLRSRLGQKDRMRVEAILARLESRPGDALVILREMNNIWPDDNEVLQTLIEILYWYGYMEETLQVSAKGVALFPDDPTLASYHSGALSYRGRVREAHDFQKNYAERNPHDLNAWDTVAENFLCLGLPDSAEVYYRRVLQKDKDYLFSQTGLGNCEYARGNNSNAINIYEQILQRKDLSPSRRRLLITESRYGSSLMFLYLETGCFEKSLELLEEAQQYVSGPYQEFQLERNRCLVLLRMGRANEVLQWARSFEKRMDIVVSRSVAAKYRAKALIMLDSLQTARPAVTELLALKEDRGGSSIYDAYEVAALIALAENNPGKAFEALNAMSQIMIPYRGGFYLLNYREIKSRALYMAGRLEEAAQEHRELLSVFGGHALSHYELGKLYEEMKRPADARREYEIFLEMWSEADEGLPQPEDARRRLASLTSR